MATTYLQEISEAWIDQEHMFDDLRSIFNEILWEVSNSLFQESLNTKDKAIQALQISTLLKH